MSVLVEIVYPGADNVSLVTFKQRSDEDETLTAINFTNATRFVLTLGSLVVDDSLEVEISKADAVNGQLQFDLSGQTIPDGEQYATLRVYDPAHTNGQIVVHADDEILMFKARDV